MNCLVNEGGNKVKNNALDDFGRILIENVRDTTIEQWEMIVSGKMKGERGKRIKQILEPKFNEKQLDIVTDLVSQIVDSAVHNLLVTLEQEEIEVYLSNNEQVKTNIVLLSDGLAGELYTEDGWICKYSTKKHIAPI
jgi:hypothetical protein